MSERGTSVGTSAFGLVSGDTNLKSVGSLAFGPEGILFVADNVGARIVAIDTGDDGATGEAHAIEIEQIDTRLAAYLGCPREDVFIRDMATHPASQNIYLSVMRGSGEAAIPVLIRIGADGALSDVSLDNVPFAETAVEDAPGADDARKDVRVVRDPREGEEVEPRPGFRLRIARDELRAVTVTDLAYVDGALLVAGASNEEFSSALRRIPFPFTGEAATRSLEIFHVSHGKYETAAPIRTFVPYGDANVLASFTCTPVVHFSLGDIASETQLKGRTVAELGAGNTPIDMVSYEREGQEYLLVSNSRHPLMKIACRDIDGQEPLTEPRTPNGVPRETLSHQGVGRMATRGGSHVLMMQQDDGGNVHLRSYNTATL